MTVPVQRGERDDPTVTNLILGRLDDLASGFQRLEDRITQRVEGLSDQFVPRGEYEARHGEVRNLITRTDARVDGEATERKALEEKLAARIDGEATERNTLEKKLIDQRRYALTTSLLGLGGLIGLLTYIQSNLPT